MYAGNRMACRHTRRHRCKIKLFHGESPLIPFALYFYLTPQLWQIKDVFVAIMAQLWQLWLNYGNCGIFGTGLTNKVSKKQKIKRFAISVFIFNINILSETARALTRGGLVQVSASVPTKAGIAVPLSGLASSSQLFPRTGSTCRGGLHSPRNCDFMF